MSADDRAGTHPLAERLGFLLAAAVIVPGVALRLTGTHFSDPVDALLYGSSIVGAAFVLSWAAEVAQLDISAGLAIAVLAFIAVLPEYAVDMVFAWKGGQAVAAYGPSCAAAGSIGESSCSLALANMTGANRLLIGIGWSLVVFLIWFRSRKRGAATTEVLLERPHTIEVGFLGLATLYSLTLPLRSSITLIDALVLVGIFVAYTIRISKAPAEEPHLVGPALVLGGLPTARRRATVLAMFVLAATVIILCAEHFAESLVLTGQTFGVSEFLLVQWLAPLASEAPELLIAGLFAWRLNHESALGTLVSSKVNQWTLLVGTLPIVFALAVGGFQGLPIDVQQREELFLTAAQSFFAVSVLVSLSISTREALLLFGLFWAQFLLGALAPASLAGTERVAVGVLYLLLGVGILIRQRHALGPLIRDGFRRPHGELASGRTTSGTD